MKFVAIGGGILYTDYENKWTCDYISSLKRIIELTNKDNPNILILAHATEVMTDEINNAKIWESIFKRLGAVPKTLLSIDLQDQEKYKYLLDWADVIFEDGGNSLKMMRLWNKSGFEIALKSTQNKVYSGLSAGANCWFSSFNSSTLNGIVEEKGLDFIDAYFVPHSDIQERVITLPKII